MRFRIPRSNGSRPSQQSCHSNLFESSAGSSPAQGLFQCFWCRQGIRPRVEDLSKWYIPRLSRSYLYEIVSETQRFRDRHREQGCSHPPWRRRTCQFKVGGRNPRGGRRDDLEWIRHCWNDIEVSEPVPIFQLPTDNYRFQLWDHRATRSSGTVWPFPQEIVPMVHVITTDGASHTHKVGSLNDMFPKIRPLSVEEMLGQYWGFDSSATRWLGPAITLSHAKSNQWPVVRAWTRLSPWEDVIQYR